MGRKGLHCTQWGKKKHINSIVNKTIMRAFCILYLLFFLQEVFPTSKA